MKICTANLHYNVAWAQVSPAAFLERMPSLSCLPASLAAGGHQVDVVQLYPQSASFTSQNVNYHFVRPVPPAAGWARVVSSMNGQSWTRQLPAVGAVRRVLSLQPDVIHFHGLMLNSALYLLQWLRGKSGPAIVGQYHGGRTAKGPLARKMQLHGLKHVQRALFGDRAAADRFVDEGLLTRRQVVIMTDRSTTLTMRSRAEARQASDMQGSPVFLWHADLQPDRDPMTALQGFEYVFRGWPKAQLYLYYEDDTLLAQLRAYVVARPELAEHVHFRGRLPAGCQADVFNSADFLLQTDRQADRHHAVLEAMACGVIPIVSDISPFRILVDSGRCGFLFPQGDAASMANQLLAFSPGQIAGKAALVHDWFEAAYSYDAQANLLLDIFAEAIDERMAQIERFDQPLTETSSQ